MSLITSPSHMSTISDSSSLTQKRFRFCTLLQRGSAMHPAHVVWADIKINKILIDRLIDCSCSRVFKLFATCKSRGFRTWSPDSSAMVLVEETFLHADKQKAELTSSMPVILWRVSVMEGNPSFRPRTEAPIQPAAIMDGGYSMNLQSVRHTAQNNALYWWKQSAAITDDGYNTAICKTHSTKSLGSMICTVLFVCCCGVVGFIIFYRTCICVCARYLTADTNISTHSNSDQSLAVLKSCVWGWLQNCIGKEKEKARKEKPWLVQGKQLVTAYDCASRRPRLLTMAAPQTARGMWEGWTRLNIFALCLAPHVTWLAREKKSTVSF